MNHAYNITFFVASVLILAGCKVEGESFDPSPEAIEFVLPVAAQSKGVEMTTGNISSFGVFAAMEDDQTNGFDQIETAELQLYMDDVPVSKSTNVWVSSPVYYWPVLQDKHISFFAYAPHSSSAEIIAEAGWSGDGELDKNVRISYTLDPDPSRHVDLSVAKAVLDRARDNDGDGEMDPVNLDFNHTLSWISFAANYIGTLPEGCVLKIDELVISNVAVSGELTLNSSQDDEAFFGWDEVTADQQTEKISLSMVNQTLENNVPLPARNESNDNHVNFATAKGAVFVIPQKVNHAGVTIPATISLTFSYVRSSDSAIIAQFYTQMEIPESDWNVAERVKYIFTVDVTTASLIEISSVGGEWINDWQESGNSHDATTIK